MKSDGTLNNKEAVAWRVGAFYGMSDMLNFIEAHPEVGERRNGLRYVMVCFNVGPLDQWAMQEGPKAGERPYIGDWWKSLEPRQKEFILKHGLLPKELRQEFE